MNQLFISSDAFLALNDPNNLNHKHASVFISSLFNKTVKLYSSIVEVSCAAERIAATVGAQKAHRFVELILNDSGIILLPIDSAMYSNLVSRGQKTGGFKKSLMVETMRANGIKDVFSFDVSIRDLNVMVWPKS